MQTARLTGNPNTVNEIHVCDVTVGVWCAANARKTMGTLFFSEAINSYHYFWLMKVPTHKELKIRKNKVRSYKIMDGPHT